MIRDNFFFPLIAIKQQCIIRKSTIIYHAISSVQNLGYNIYIDIFFAIYYYLSNAMSGKNFFPTRSTVEQNIPASVKKGEIPIPAWALAVIIIFTAFLYSKVLQNDFVYWDDDVYILKNSYIRNFSLTGIVDIFTKFNISNYHPLTTLTNLFEFRLFGLNPLPYHLFNVGFHLLNTWLVFRFTEKLSGKRITAFIVCILFAVHPLHVESVAWASERKDVLYASFYLLSLLAYSNYLTSGFSKKQYTYSLLLFLASLLSKPAAVTLPFLLIAIDMYKGRTVGAKSLIEKLPFVLLSVFFGVLTIMAQKIGGSLHHLSDSFGFANNIFLFTSRISFYIIESVIPYRLCAVNCLPEISGSFLPWYYYLSLPFLLVLTWLIAKKNKLRTEVLFGVTFFLITISVMLQIINVGFEFTADRYTYIPYVGLFYIIGQFITFIIYKYKNCAIIIFISFTFFLSLFTYVRVGIWRDTDTLFNDVLEKNSEHINNCYILYFWGLQKKDEDDIQGALEKFSNAIALNNKYKEAYYSRGLLYEKKGDMQNALNDFDSAIHLDPKNAYYYNSRGWAYYKTGNKNSAMLDYKLAINIDPEFADAYNNKGWAYYEANDLDSALVNFNKAITIDPTFSKPYFNRANIYVKNGNLNAASADYSTIITFHPHDSLAYFNRGIIHINMKDSSSACSDWQKAILLGYNDASILLQQYCH